MELLRNYSSQNDEHSQQTLGESPFDILFQLFRSTLQLKHRLSGKNNKSGK